MAHSSLWKNKKLARLTRAVKEECKAPQWRAQLEAVGLVSTLWRNANEQTSIGPNGWLNGWTDVDVSSLAGWDAEPSLFVEMMVDAGFLDRKGKDLQIHGYLRWSSNYLRRRWQRAGLVEIVDRKCVLTEAGMHFGAPTGVDGAPSTAHDVSSQPKATIEKDKNLSRAPRAPPKRKGTKERAERPRDRYWDGLQRAFRPNGVPSSEYSKFGLLCKTLEELKADPDEIPGRIRRYCELWSGIKCTVNALVAHWDDCEDPAIERRKAEDELQKNQAVQRAKEAEQRKRDSTLFTEKRQAFIETQSDDDLDQWKERLMEKSTTWHEHYKDADPREHAGLQGQIYLLSKESASRPGMGDDG